MTTSEELKKISDAAKFEAIAVAYLKIYKAEFANLLHTGVNSSGKIRKDPLDGFLQTEINDKTAFVFFEFTTEDQKKLEDKWLKDLSSYKRKPPKTVKEGDILKAAKEANELRKSFPEAFFYIVLSTNRHVSTSLAKKVATKCKELNLKNGGIFAFSNIYDFLENTPEGHWIRQKYLGISAQLLSPNLLKWISKKNLTQYSKDIFYSLNSNIINTVSYTHLTLPTILRV